MIGLLDGMSRATKLKFISTRHEQIAAHAADGYACLTHKASVLMCHLGPGLTNTLTGVANASLDSIPMVVICGDVPSYYFGRHAHQEVIMHGDATQYRLFEPIAKRVWRIDDAESLPYILDKALNADYILAIGTRFGEADSSSWYPGVTFDERKTKFMQIDIDPSEIGRNYPVELGAIADAKHALKQILAAAKTLVPEGKKNPELLAAIAKNKADFKKSNEAISNDSRFPMTPQRILKDVKEAIPEDAYIFTDVGWNKNGVAQEFDVNVPGTIHHCSGLATMGFGAAAVLGGAVAAQKQGRIALTLTGDGGFGAANPCVMATAVEQGIPAIWVVMDNSKFGTINGLENGNYGHAFGTVFQTPDGQSYNPKWEEAAKAYGVDSVRVNSADEFLPAMKKAVEMAKADKPFLVEAPMENIVVPTPRLLEHQRYLHSQGRHQERQTPSRRERRVPCT